MAGNRRPGIIWVFLYGRRERRVLGDALFSLAVFIGAESP